MTRTVVILAAGSGTRISVWKREVPKPLIRLCGMPMIERTIRLAQRAGFHDFVVVTGCRGGEIQEHLGHGDHLGVRITYADNPDWKKSNGVSLLKAEPFVRGGEFALLMADHVVDAGVFRRLADASLGTDDLVLFTDGRVDQIFDIPDATKVKLSGREITDIGKNLSAYDAIDTGVFLCSSKIFDHLRGIEKEKGDASLSDGVRTLARIGKARSEDIGDGWWQDVDTAAAYHHAEKVLLRSLRKPTDVFVSRHFNRPVSLFLTKYLCRTSVRPDMISLLGFAVGLIAPLFLIQGTYWGFVAGAFFYHFSSILDGCDGELARVKMMESHRGEWVDTIADVISHFVFTLGLTVGLYVQSGSRLYTALGGAAFIGMTTLLYTMFQYLTKVARRGSLIAFDKDYASLTAQDRGISNRLARLLKPLIRRATFAFLFFVLAVLGKIEWVLFLIAFGTNLATVLVYVTFRRRLRALAAEPTRP